MEPNTFEREMKKFDSLLRLRRAKLGSWFFIERKARRETSAVPKPVELASIDRYIRDSQGYVLVTRLRKSDLNKDMLHTLRSADMWSKRHGKFGAEGVAAEEAAMEVVKEEYQDRKDSELLQEHSMEVYDKKMSEQGDVVYPGLSGNVSGVKK